ncbi:MAG: MoaD/ThiS family protein [Pirellulaceae bacterium]
MARVFVPVAVRSLIGGREMIEVDGRNVRELIDHLDAQFPGVKDRFCQGDQLTPGVAVSVGGSVSALGLLQPVDSDSEVHFLPAIGGG